MQIACHFPFYHMPPGRAQVYETNLALWLNSVGECDVMLKKTFSLWKQRQRNRLCIWINSATPIKIAYCIFITEFRLVSFRLSQYWYTFFFLNHSEINRTPSLMLELYFLNYLWFMQGCQNHFYCPEKACYNSTTIQMYLQFIL